MNNSTDYCFNPIGTEQVVSIAIIAISSFIGVVLNVVLVIVVATTTCQGSTSRQFQTMMILSISLSDLAYLICAPVHDISTIFQHRLLSSIEICRMFAFILIITQGVSSLSLCLLSFDRYRAILKPMQHRQWQQKRRYALATATIWIISVLMTIPQLTISGNFSFSCEQGPGKYSCDHISFDTFAKVYYTIQVLLFYIFPLIFITLCYSRIAYKLRQSPQFDANVSQAKATEQRCKLSVALIIISISFGVCWFPLMFAKLCFQYIDIFAKFDYNKWAIFLKACPIFVYFNCSLDPIIIFTLSRKYRIALKKPFTNWKLLPNTMSFHRRSTFITETVVLDTVQPNHSERRSLKIKLRSSFK